MSIESLSVPWAVAPEIPTPPPGMAGVDVLQGYTAAGDTAAGSTLSHPWSEQSPAAVPQLPEVTSLIGMTLSD